MARAECEAGTIMRGQEQQPDEYLYSRFIPCVQLVRHVHDTCVEWMQHCAAVGLVSYPDLIT